MTLREVGGAANVSHNAPYRHFADKGALLAAVAARELARQGVSVRKSDPSIANVRAQLQGYVRWTLRYPERFRLTFGRLERRDGELAQTAIDPRRALARGARRRPGVRRVAPRRS